MKVVIAGTGNVATVLSKKIKKVGHEIAAIYGREKNKAAELAIQVQAEAVTELSAIPADADLYIIAVSDAAIPLIAGQLKLPGKLVVHTAAAVPSKILSSVSADYGVIYPLQSLRKNSTYIPEIPVFIDGSSQAVIKKISSFTQTVFEKTTVAGDTERLKLHVAAVFISNFTNHLYALAEIFCRQENLDFQNLLPLMQETALRLKEHKPAEMQTGPAVRSDLATINAHLQLLENNPHLKEIYELLTRSIIELHRHPV